RNRNPGRQSQKRKLQNGKSVPGIPQRTEPERRRSQRPDRTSDHPDEDSGKGSERSSAGHRSRNRRILRGRKGDPVHEKTLARRPCRRQRKQKRSRSRAESAGSRQL